MSTTKLNTCVNSWDRAIRDANERIEQLQTAISVYRENKVKGVPWPGKQVEAQTSEPCHSV